MGRLGPKAIFRRQILSNIPLPGWNMWNNSDRQASDTNGAAAHGKWGACAAAAASGEGLRSTVKASKHFLPKPALANNLLLHCVGLSHLNNDMLPKGISECLTLLGYARLPAEKDSVAVSTHMATLRKRAKSK